jgi:HNH endonuclease.
MGEWRSQLTGEDHPLYEGGKETLSCEQCGEQFKIVSAKADERRFCSQDCMGEWYSVHQSGQDHPGWRGGKSVYDAVKTLLSDESWEWISQNHRSQNTVCQLCGTDKRLHTHHIIPVMSGGTNESWNLMTLCVNCHGKAESFTRNSVPPVLINEEGAE